LTLDSRLPISSDAQEYDVSDETKDPDIEAGTERGPVGDEPEDAPEGAGEPGASEQNTEDGDIEDVDAAKAGGSATSRLEELENEGDIAADYLEELLDIADLDGDLDMDVEADRAAVSIVGGELNRLVGPDGDVLDALQELTRLAVYRETGERSRLMLDIGGHRADKRTRLEKLAAETVGQVRDSGEPVSLTPMSPFERKVVHDAVATAGLQSGSEGEEPRRYVVVRPA